MNAKHEDPNEAAAKEISFSPVEGEDSQRIPSSNDTSVDVSPALKDGGTRAWLQVAGSFLVFGNLWGFTFAFGSFQSYYQLNYLPSESASSISWIGTISTFFLIVGGVLSGPLFDLGFFRAMLLTGAITETIGVFLTSICDKYWQLFLTQGVLMGIGNCFLYAPGLALVGRSFKKNRAIAMGITTCGAPAGGVIYTLVFEQLISRCGFGWTVRIMGFVMLSSYLISFPLILFRADNIGKLASGTKRRLLDITAFKDLLFWMYTTANFAVFMGYIVPFYYMASYGQEVLGMSRSASLNVIIISQAASILGRLIAGYSARRIGVMLPWATCALSSGVFCIAWIDAHAPASFIAVAALYGCFSGALIPLPPSVFPIVCQDPRVLGTRLGMAQGIGAIASLTGPPIAGALAQVTSSDHHTPYLGLQLFAGLMLICGSINLIALWILLVNQRDLGIWI